ncbi:L-histidine N(alpha)-methyltransferase [Jiulongibacter sp. NS-SX5]|uniref:L-histidine N(alpha)-methyltransferase n=1 Tax=Jiulongibacter sp. NS-SX5 TaxID=3463854 RepID=UPI004057CDEB
MDNPFLEDMLAGLQRQPKTLSSKYFYDKEGDKIFQEIMNMESYYLPSCELEIIEQKTEDIAKQIGSTELDVIELGAGDGVKTVKLIQGLLAAGKKVNYVPLDISPDVLETNKSNILKQLPQLSIEPIAGDYFKTMQKLSGRTKPKLILFLGSNIGNFKGQSGVDFLTLVKKHTTAEDYLLLGADLKKDPEIILKAYNDPEGITARFNLNLLHRMNKELNANFDLANFKHYPYYNPISGTCYSYLISLKDQKVEIADSTIFFQKNEPLHTEVSQKYSLQDLEELILAAGFNGIESFLDTKEWFSLSLIR